MIARTRSGKSSSSQVRWFGLAWLPAVMVVLFHACVALGESQAGTPGETLGANEAAMQALLAGRDARAAVAEGLASKAVPWKARQGDAAEMVYLELVDYEPAPTPFAMARARAARDDEAAEPAEE